MAQVHFTLSSCYIYEGAWVGAIIMGQLSGPWFQLMQSLMGI